jgi:hypothetical protein
MTLRQVACRRIDVGQTRFPMSRLSSLKQLALPGHYERFRRSFS